MSGVVQAIIPWAVSFAITAIVFGLIVVLSGIPSEEDNQHSARLAGCILFAIALGVVAPLEFGMPENWALPFVFWGCNLAIFGVLLRWELRSTLIACALWSVGFGVLGNYILFRYDPAPAWQIALKSAGLLLFTVSILLFFIAIFQKSQPPWWQRILLRNKKPSITPYSVVSSLGGAAGSAAAFITQAKDLQVIKIIIDVLHVVIR